MSVAITLRTVLIALLLAAPAVAQDKPPLHPTRDATIDYRMEGGRGGPKTMRMYVTAGGTRTRMEPSEGNVAIVVDRAAGKMMIVMLDQRKFMERPVGAGMPGGFDLPGGANFARKGSDTVAGLSCTIWEGNNDRHSTACVTDDGLILRGESQAPSGERTGLVATSVTVGPVSPELFKPPAGFTAFERPGAPATRP